MLQLEEIMEQARERRVELERVLGVAEQELRNINVQGRVRITHSNGTVQFYHIKNPADKRGSYIRKKDKKLIRQLARKDYLSKLTKCLRAEIAFLEDMESRAPRHCGGEDFFTPEALYDDMHAERQSLIQPCVMSREEFARRWEEEPYTQSNFKIEEKKYATKKGDMVRSKSEMMLADMFYEMGIPYRYECKLKLKDGREIYPDFTLLKKSTGEVIYYEHLGLMNQEEYRLCNMKKIEDYRKTGIILGKNLLISFEEEGCPLNIREIAQSMKCML